MAQYSIRIEIKSLPQGEPEGMDMFVAGSFNGWNAQDSSHRFQRDPDGNYFIILTLVEGDYEYKITRGGWNRVECKKDGASADNRSLKVVDHETVLLDIEGWADQFPDKPRPSTASKNVYVLDGAFFIPQLKRTRKVWIYLPAEYHESKNRYPVLYLQDGQNVFDEATAFDDEWGIDEYLDATTTLKSIVVAVDNGGEHRMTEYNPYDRDEPGKAEGDKYAEFLVKTLKPFIDKNYRTQKSKAHCFIAGSSMGGLISFYCLLKYPKVFAGAGIFSPSFRLAPGIYDDVTKRATAVDSRIYFYCGKDEGGTMAEDMLRVVAIMKQLSAATIETVVRPGGRHTEDSWRTEFAPFYEWLMK